MSAAGQKREPDLITDGCESPCGYWELNSAPLEEQAVLLTSELSLQPLSVGFEARSHHSFRQAFSSLSSPV